MANLKSFKSNVEVYHSHNPEDFHEALAEFSKYCERQLPLISFIAFTPSCFDISGDEETILVGGLIGNVATFDVPTGQILRDEDISHGNAITSIIFVLDDKQVVGLTQDFGLFFLDFPSLEVLFRIQVKEFPTVLKNGSRKQNLYYVNGTKEMGIIKLSLEEDFYTRKFSKRSFALEHNSGCIEISDDGSLIALGHENGTISILHVDTEHRLKSTPEQSSKPIIIAFSESHHFLAAGFEDHVIRVWNLDNQISLKFEFAKHTDTITGIAFVRDNRYVVSSSLDTDINVWDIKIEGLPYKMNITDSKVNQLKVSKDHQHVHYIQESAHIMTWNVPQLPRNARYRGHSGKVNKVLFVPNTVELISIGDDGCAMVWDYRNDKHIETLRLQGSLTHAAISKDGHMALIASTKPCIYKWNLGKNSVEEYPLRGIAYSLQFSQNEDYYAVSDAQDRLAIYESRSHEPFSTIKGHTDKITDSCFIKNDRFVLTASRDCSLGKWDFNSSERIGTFAGHEAAVTSMVVSHEGLLLSGSEDGAIILWNFDTLMLYTFSITEASPILGLYFSMDHSFAISLQANRLSYWQMDNLSIMFQIDTTAESNCLAISPDEKFVAVTEFDSVFIEENALGTTNIRIVGKNLGSPHKFMKFVIDCQKDNSKVEYDMNHNHWAIAPYMLGVAHILSYCNRFVDLNAAFFHPSNRASFFGSINNENPLSICVELEYKNCIDICIKYMKNQNIGKNGNPKNLRAFVPLESCLAKLNSIEYPYIVKLYDNLFIEADDAYLPRFSMHDADLPSLYLSDHLVIYPNELLPKESYSNTGRPIVFSHSTIPLDLDTGTNGSIDFINSLLECHDHEVFRSSVVIEYLQCKWLKVKPWIYVQGFTFWFYLFLLAWYIVIVPEPIEDYPYKMTLLWVIIVVHIILLSYEVLQIATDFIDYWSSIWNILDQLRSLSFTFYAIMAYQEKYNYDILLAVLIFSWSRGIACFRMFDETRYMVRLILQVIIDITTFFFILGYATLAFAFIFYLRNPDAQPFPMFLTQAYRLDLGDFETDLTETFDWLMFFVSTMINPLIMLNLLIAIMSDTAAAVAEIDDICGNRELAEMILDVEKAMFWKRQLTHKHYLHKCDFVVVETADNDKVMEKVKFIKKQVMSMRGTVKNIRISVGKIVENNIQESVSVLKEQQDVLKAEMDSKFETSNQLINRISSKLAIS